MILEQFPQQATNGEAFSFSSSYIQGDAVPTSAASVGSVGNFSSQTSYASGTAGNLAGTIATDGGIRLRLVELVALLLANLSQRSR